MGQKHRFTPAIDNSDVYIDGTEISHRMQKIERQRQDGTWEVRGYVEIHTHRVIFDDSDVEDISVGVTVRINPKREKANGP